MDVNVTIKITRTTDGSSVEFKHSLYQTDDYDGIYLWRDGNYSCDCNRYLFFERAKGTSEEEIDANDSGRCSGTLYRVDWIKDEAGNVLFEEK